MTVIGNNGQIELLEDLLIIKRKGFTAFMNHGFKGEKRIPYASITAVQFKEPGPFTPMSGGYIQFSLMGGIENTGARLDAHKDENTVTFGYGQSLENFRKVRDLVQQSMMWARSNYAQHQAAPSSSIADELAKLANLRSAGILTDAEFEEQKRRLLSKM